MDIYPGSSASGGHRLVIMPDASNVATGGIVAPFVLSAGETCCVRVIVDKNIIEVFLDDRQTIATVHPHSTGPGGVNLSARNEVVVDVRSWTIRSICP